MIPNQSPIDAQREFVEELLTQGKSNTEILDALRRKGVPTTRHSLRRAFKRWNKTESKETVSIEGDHAVVTGPITPAEVSDADKLIRDRGFDPEVWTPDSITLNEWDAPTVDGTSRMQQLKVNLKRVRPIFMVEPARVPGGYIRPKQQQKKHKGAELVVFVGDQQAPFHDSQLHELFCQWLKENQPDRGVMIGDTIDLPDVSRHRLDPENTARVQTCVNSGYAICRDYVQANEATEWVKLCGNHDERIRNYLIERAVELYDLKRAEVEGSAEPSIFSIAHLLRLDELGIEYLEPFGSYDQIQHNVSPYLAARHGWIARKGAGASALATLEHLGYSVIVGHTHRQGRVHKTTHDIDGKPSTLTAVETGCMCKIEKGLNYTVSPDWQNGFATATVWPDGKFNLDLATYTKDMLVWRDKRYG